MKIGDKVRFLSEVGGGIVKGFRGKDIQMRMKVRICLGASAGILITIFLI